MITRRGMLAIIAGLAVLALLTGVLIGGAIWFLSSEPGLRWAVDKAHALTEGKLSLGLAGLAGWQAICATELQRPGLAIHCRNVGIHLVSARALFAQRGNRLADRVPRLPHSKIE